MPHRALKLHFSELEESSDEPGVNEARGYACEFVAWQFLTNLTERETIDFLLYELPALPSPSEGGSDAENGNRTRTNGSSGPLTEESPLLRQGRTSSYFGTDSVRAGALTSVARSDDFTTKFENLSALEIAAVSNSKKFLSQRPVQKIINGLWRVRTCTFQIFCFSPSRAISFSGSHLASILSSVLNCIIAGVPIYVRYDLIL